MPVEELSPGVYGWAGQEGVRLRQPIGSGGGGSSAPQLVVEMMTEIRDKASSAQPVRVGLDRRHGEQRTAAQPCHQGTGFVQPAMDTLTHPAIGRM